MRDGARVVYGASWRRQGDRRQRAARIARMLRPVVDAVGGVVSTEFTVSYRGQWFRPDVGVLLAPDHPIDGVLASAPSLVIRLGNPLSADAWLQAGADAVWALEGGTVWELSRSHRRALTSEERLRHPGEVALHLPAHELIGDATPRARVGA